MEKHKEKDCINQLGAHAQLHWWAHIAGLVIKRLITTKFTMGKHKENDCVNQSGAQVQLKQWTNKTRL